MCSKASTVCGGQTCTCPLKSQDRLCSLDSFPDVAKQISSQGKVHLSHIAVVAELVNGLISLTT